MPEGIMNSGGRACWRGVATERLQTSACKCGHGDPPPFDLVFPGSAGPEFPSVAPSTWSNDSLISVRTYTALPTGVSRTGGGVGPGGGGDTATISPPVTQGGNNVAARGLVHPRSVNLLIGAGIALFILILLLCCLLYFCKKKKKKKRHDIVQRPGPEGCEANRVPYDAPATDHQPNNKNEFPLLQIAEPCQPNNETPITRDVSAGTESPFVIRNFPVLRTVKAAVVSIGSPKKVGSPKKATRPVSRQDSTAPLVEHQASIFRDRWKDKSRSYGTATDDIDSNRLSADGDDDDDDHRDRLTTLHEDDVNVPNGKLPTKLETLPTRMYPAQSVMSSPKRSNKRPDSSTPLFDSDSISSSEA